MFSNFYFQKYFQTNKIWLRPCSRGVELLTHNPNNGGSNPTTLDRKWGKINKI